MPENADGIAVVGAVNNAVGTFVQPLFKGIAVVIQVLNNRAVFADMGYFQTEMFDDLFRRCMCRCRIGTRIWRLANPLVFNRQYVIAAFDRNGPCVAVQTRHSDEVEGSGHIVDTGFIVALGNGNA